MDRNNPDSERVRSAPNEARRVGHASLLITGEPAKEKEDLYSVSLWFAEFLRYGPRPPLADALGEGAFLVNSAVRRGLAREVLVKVRRAFPHLAVIFCDGNTEPDIPFALDLTAVKKVVEVGMTRSAAFSFGKRKTTTCGIVVLGLTDIIDLDYGLVEEFPPAMYVYLASEDPIDRALVSTVLNSAHAFDHLIEGVVREQMLALMLLPDADGFRAFAATPEALVRCGLARATPS